MIQRLTPSQSKMIQNQQFKIDLERINLELFGILPELLEHFGVLNVRTNSGRYTTCCPIHGGDNPTAFSCTAKGWRCFTHKCNDVFTGTYIGLVRAFLSKRNGWTGGKLNLYSFQDTLKYIYGILDQSECNFFVERTSNSNAAFTKAAETLSHKRQECAPIMTREFVRKKLIIPAEYFIQRGFSRTTLDTYDVGLYNGTEAKRLIDRVSVPVYNDEYTHVVGFLGRSIHNQCPVCKFYHRPTADCVDDGYGKWINSFGFQSENYLYNYWFAKKHIHECGVAVLVEGQGDVWKLVENDIHCGVGLFKCAVSENQLDILQNSGAFTLIIATDNDEAGRTAAATIARKVRHHFTPIIFDYGSKDIGEATNEEFTRLRKLITSLSM